jgi:hypothetical protein
MDDMKIETKPETVKPLVPSSDHLPHDPAPSFIPPPVKASDTAFTPKPPAPAAKVETADAKAARLAAEQAAAAAKLDADAEKEAGRQNVIARYDMTGERAMIGNEVFCANVSAHVALRDLALCLLVTGDGAVAVGISHSSGESAGLARGEAYRDALSYLSAKRPVKAA